MNKKERLLAAHLLEMASDQFCNHGCNDLNLKKLGWTTEERRNLMQRMHESNGDPEEFDPSYDYEYFTDHWVMSFLADKLEEEANKD